jgi:hypothetical protein
MCETHDTTPQIVVNDRLRKFLVLGCIADADKPITTDELLDKLEHGLSSWRVAADLDCLEQRARIRREDDGRWALL